MKLIQEVFDESKLINRRIEKVIFFDASSEQQLKNEITEYVVTDNLSENFENLLDKFESGMDGSGNNEIGVWVSGFYGSGKSSFTKYLGFALDDSKVIDGEPFLKYLQNQIKSTTLRQRLATVAKKYPTAVFMLDLSVDKLTDTSMKEISQVLYSKVIMWAGYSKEKKIAHLEFLLEKDGKYDQFKDRIKEITKGKSWEQIKDQPLLTKTFASQLASEFYPDIWPDKKAFNEIKIEEMISEGELVDDTLSLIIRKSKKENIIFIIDEVGQYIAPREDLILNLDGLAKALKNKGKGKVWIIATAQQTLTEDDPSAILNSAKLFKLKDRFPISIDLEASDIKEICWNRLLSKSKAGENELLKLFDRYGEQLKYSTQLRDTRFYKSALDKDQFQRLYPLLPQHFDILLELLGKLAKSSGGYGLRSAIKVIQDILVDQSGNRGKKDLLAEEPLGNLATTSHIYNTLKKDIERSYKHLVEAVEKVGKIYNNDSIHVTVAKSVAVLQILEDFPVTRANIAALIHSSVSSKSMVDEVEIAVADLITERSIPLSEVDGNLKFMSEGVNRLEVERNKIFPSSSDIKSNLNNAINDIFTPVPSSTLLSTKKVNMGLKIIRNDRPAIIFGDKETIQFYCEFANVPDYDKKIKERILESQQSSNQYNVYMIGKDDRRIEDLIVDIFRSNKIYKDNIYKFSDKEISDYLRGQLQQADKKSIELKSLLKEKLVEGSFIFQGKQHALGQFADNPNDSAKAYLANIAPEVFSKYKEASVQLSASTAEKFLKTEKLDKISSDLDPLRLVTKEGKINISHSAIISIKDYLQRFGQVEGRKLLDDLFDAPYGWQKDTTRYVVAAMLVAGILKLRISGEDFLVRGDTSINALSTTNNFNKIGIALRDTPIPPDALLRASDRIRDLIGSDVLPLEDEISKTVIKHFPDINNDLASLPTKIKILELDGEEKAQSVLDDVTELLKGDASDAANRLGGESCRLYDDILWAREVKDSFANGIDTLIKELKSTISQIEKLPGSGVFIKLKSDCKDTIDRIKEYISGDNFYMHFIQLQKLSGSLKGLIKNYAVEFFNEQNHFIDSEIKKIESLPEWSIIGLEKQNYFAQIVTSLKIDIEYDIEGIEKLLNHKYTIDNQLISCKEEIIKIAEDEKAVEDNGEIPDTEGIKEVSFPCLPDTVSNPSEIDDLIRELEKLKNELSLYSKIKITWK